MRNRKQRLFERRFWVALLLVATATQLLSAAPASADHIAGATYNGTVAINGTAMSFTVSADGSGVTAFSVAGPLPGNSCTFSGISATYPTPLPITNHTFTDTTAPLTFSGSFPAVQSAQGTLKIATTSPSCTTGDLAWNATTTSTPPPPPPPPLPPPPPPVAAAPCKVPNVKGKTLPAAKAALTRAKCSVGRVTKAYSSRFKKGRVTSQKPRPGTRLKNRGKVHLVMSRGPRP